MNLHSFPTQQRGARRRTDANKRGESRHPEAGGGFVGWTDKASRSGRGVSGGQGDCFWRGERRGAGWAAGEVVDAGIPQVGAEARRRERGGLDEERVRAQV
jgi:hypothetical protein